MSLKDNIIDIVGKEIEGIWTATLGTVTKGGLRCVDVQIKHKIKKKDKTMEFPILTSVPVLYPRTANISFVSPLEVGDTVLLIFLKFNALGALDSSKVLLTKDSRRFSLNDYVCIPAFFLSSDKLPSVTEGGAVIEHKSGSYIKFKSDGSIEIYTTKLDIIKK